MKFKEWIKQFPKLEKIWNSIPEPNRTWFETQIFAYAQEQAKVSPNAVLNADWRDAEKDFPPFDKEVIGYYELPETDGNRKPTGKIFKYYVICHLQSVTEGSGYKYAEWVDKEHNPVKPKLWTELPVLPSCI